METLLFIVFALGWAAATILTVHIAFPGLLSSANDDGPTAAAVGVFVALMLFVWWLYLPLGLIIRAATKPVK